MHLRLATELQLYMDGLIKLDSLSKVAHELLDAWEEDTALLMVCHLITDHNKGAISEEQLKSMLPTPRIEVERDTLISNRIPTPPPLKDIDT